MHETADRLSDQLNAFASSVEGTSLYLLRAINETVGALGSDERLARACSEVAVSLAKRISDREVVPGRLIDPEDVAIADLESGYSGLESALPAIVLKKSSVDRDGNLHKEQSELLHSAYQTCIDSIAGLIEALKDLRAAVIRHDLAAEVVPSETFDSVAELSKSLRSSAA